MVGDIMDSRYSVGDLVWIDPESGTCDGEAVIEEDTGFGYFVTNDCGYHYVTDDEVERLLLTAAAAA